MRRILSTILSLILLSSCMTYTVQMGLDTIEIPEEVTEPKTKYSEIVDIELASPSVES